MLFDTHAHLTDEAFDEDREKVIGSLKDAGVSLVLNAGTCVKTSQESVALAEQYDFIYMPRLGFTRTIAQGRRMAILKRIAEFAKVKKRSRSVRSDLTIIMISRRGTFRKCGLSGRWRLHTNFTCRSLSMIGRHMRIRLKLSGRLKSKKAYTTVIQEA